MISRTLSPVDRTGDRFLNRDPAQLRMDGCGGNGTVDGGVFITCNSSFADSFLASPPLGRWRNQSKSSLTSPFIRGANDLAENRARAMPDRSYHVEMEGA